MGADSSGPGQQDQGRPRDYHSSPVAPPLAHHYSRFRVGERLLLTGHSHQAWPDVGFDAQQRAWLDAAKFVDEKWEHAEAQASRVRAGFARLLGDSADNIALGQNTHELVTRWLSALPLRDRPRLVTTDGEFHSLHRQVNRLAEEGLEIVAVHVRPVDTLADRLAASLNARTACVMVSSVLFETAAIVPGLGQLAGACRRDGIPLLLDVYHHLNVVPFNVSPGLEDVFVTGGGYKYCQLGEGNCFLRVPPHCEMRPVLTGWFAAFDSRDQIGDRRVPYGTGAHAFGGATYDPTSHYRAAAVFDFFQEQGLTVARLHDINRGQVRLLKAEFERLDCPSSVAHVEPMPDELRGGFLAVRVKDAPAVARALRTRGVHTDARGDVLRLGPAPYLRDDQLRDAVRLLGEVLGFP